VGFGVSNPVCCSFCGNKATGSVDGHDVCDREECFNKATK